MDHAWDRIENHPHFGTEFNVTAMSYCTRCLVLSDEGEQNKRCLGDIFKYMPEKEGTGLEENNMNIEELDTVVNKIIITKDNVHIHILLGILKELTKMSSLLANLQNTAWLQNRRH